MRQTATRIALGSQAPPGLHRPRSTIPGTPPREAHREINSLLDDPRKPSLIRRTGNSTGGQPPFPNATRTDGPATSAKGRIVATRKAHRLRSTAERSRRPGPNSADDSGRRDQRPQRHAAERCNREAEADRKAIEKTAVGSEPLKTRVAPPFDYGRTSIWTRTTLLFLLFSISNPAWTQSHPIPPGVRQADAAEAQTQRNIPPPTQSQTGDNLTKLTQEASELAQLSQTVPLDVSNIPRGMLPKDLLPKLKRIEKLSKDLRRQLQGEH
jgi:hypothetical protein